MIFQLAYTHRVGGPGVSFGFETPQIIQELLMTLLTFRKVITSDRIMSMIGKSRSDRIESVTKVRHNEQRTDTNVRTWIF